MARYRIMYWKELPAQLHVEDGDEELRVEFPKMQEKIDEVATERGVVDTDEYLDGWEWSEFEERSGSMQQVLDAVRADLAKQFPEVAE